MTQSLPETATQAEFARLVNRKPGYISQLKTAGVLVMTGDGRRVRVRESLDALEANRNPSFDGVAARHEAERRAKAAADQPLPVPGGEGEGDGGEEEDGGLTLTQANRLLKIASAREKQIDVELAEMKLKRERGDLLHAADVRAACAAAATEARHGFERMVEALAPRLAATSDEHRIRELLHDDIAHTLEAFARALSSAGGSPA